VLNEGTILSGAKPMTTLDKHVGVELDPVSRLTRDLKAAAITLSPDEARFLVDAYYAMQEDRKRAMNQIGALSKSGEPHEVLAWLGQQTATLEGQVRRALDAYSAADPVGRWARSIVGIGPVIAAGLSAHIDISKAPTVGHIWRFAGLDPTRTWEKKTKRPWNASLKVLCWKIGESFVKVSGKEDDVYGHLYVERKVKEQARNDAGELADQAAHKLATTKIGKTTEAYAHYSAGRLPPAHIHARAKRWAVKLFLSHWHHVAYYAAHGEHPPKPYILTIEGGHAHEIRVPNWPF
jgi:hypothetical protein